MTITKRAVLAETNFGRRIAEDEADELQSYFVETEDWNKVFSGSIDIVYGPKGAGKSAIYSLLLRRTAELLKRKIVVIACENISGTPVFQDLLIDTSASEEKLRGLWKLYCLSLLGADFRSRGFKNASATRVMGALGQAGLLSKQWNLKHILRSSWDYVRGIEFGAEIEGVGKITIRQPSAEQEKRGFVSVDSLLESADDALSKESLTVWLALDRLDVAFSESAEFEAKALRALFRVYLDMAGLKHISLKIFLRDDIWQRITETGFREASHITRYTRIGWNAESLLNLVVRRALHNSLIPQYYGVVAASVLANASAQKQLFYRMFPAQVDTGTGKSSAWDWILSRSTDGRGRTSPREVIHLISAARDEQVRRIDAGNAEPTGEVLIDRMALKDALPEVSRVRFEQTLCAEHPELKPLLLKLEREKTQQTIKTLSAIWNVSNDQAAESSERLVEVGFFEKRGTKDQPEFWVPFIYRNVLKMSQGKAKSKNNRTNHR